MTITYVPMLEGCDVVERPVLHKVIYDRRETEVVLSMYQYSYKDHLVKEWLKENCKHSYYHSPGWIHEKFIEFECDSDAMWFALRWGQ